MKPKTSRRNFWILFALVAGVVFFNNNSLSLWDEDEAAYAGFAYQMIQTGDWVTPNFPWSEIHRKTPFHFWAIASSYYVFGVNEFAVRFPSALAILGTALLLWFMGRPIFGDQESRAAAVVMLCNVFLLSLAKVSVTDALLLFFQTMAVLSIFGLLRTNKFYYTILLWLAVAIGVLVKGPPIVVLAGGVYLLLAIFHPDRKNLIKAHPWIFFPLSMVPLVFWGSLAWEKDQGEFINWLIDWYILRRFTSQVLGQTGPPGYFLVLFIVFLLPFSKNLLPALRAFIQPLSRKTKVLGLVTLIVIFLGWVLNVALQFKYFSWVGIILGLAWFLFFIAGQKENLQKELAIWLVCGWGIYELLHSKLPSYSLGAMPAVALLLAYYPRTKIKKINLSNGIINTLLGVLGLAFLILPFFVLDNIIPLILAELLGLLFLLTSYFWIARSDYHHTQYALVAILLTFVLWYAIVPGLEESRSAGKQLATYAKSTLLEDQTIYISRHYHQPSLIFYLVNKGFNPITIEDFPGILYNRVIPLPLIVDNQDFKRLKDSYPLLLENNSVRKFKGMASDKGITLNYYLISKN